MPKRTDRINPIRHHRESIEALKSLEPSNTPVEWGDFSDTCMDIAYEALGMALVLEGEKRPDPARFERLVALVNSLPEKAPRPSEPVIRSYEIWSVRTETRGALFHDTVDAENFVLACRKCFEGDDGYDRATNTWCGTRLVSSEREARFGVEE